MIHFIPDSADARSELPGPYAEAVARLASIRQALACVEQMSGAPQSESLAEARLAAGWPTAPAARQRVFERRSSRAAGAAAAGLEAIAAIKDKGEEAHARAIERLKQELEASVRDADLLFSL